MSNTSKEDEDLKRAKVVMDTLWKQGDVYLLLERLVKRVEDAESLVRQYQLVIGREDAAIVDDVQRLEGRTRALSKKAALADRLYSAVQTLRLEMENPAPDLTMRHIRTQELYVIADTYAELKSNENGGTGK